MLFAAALVVAAGGAAASRAAATPPLRAGGGAEWYAGPGDQGTTVGYGYAEWTGDHVALALGGLRFDDRVSGAGAGPLAALGIRLGSAATLRTQAMRFIGDHDLRATRVRTGPEFALSGGRALGLYFTYLENNHEGVARGGSAELRAPLRAGWTGRLTGGATRLPGSITSSQGSLGLAWAPDPRVEVSAEAGLARNGAFVHVPSPGGGRRSGGPLGLPIGIGSDPAAAPPGSRRIVATDPTFSLGLRFALP